MIFCSFKDKNGMSCGRPSIYLCRCKIHLGKESSTTKKKAKRFRGDSAWQLEQGMGTSKEGSRA